MDCRSANSPASITYDGIRDVIRGDSKQTMVAGGNARWAF